MKTTEVDVYLAKTNDHDCEAMIRLLDGDSAQRLSRIRHPHRRAQFILGRWLLKEGLRHRFGAVAAHWRLDLASPKPRLAGMDAPEFSLSHSRELVACAISRTEVGLDVEFCRERDFARLAEQICDASALRGFLSLPAAERTVRFYQMWTMKEATFKLYGQGVFSPSSLASPNPADGNVVHACFQPEEGFIAALAVHSGKPIHVAMHSRLPPVAPHGWPRVDWRHWSAMQDA